MTKKNDLYESYSIDGPLEEITMEMVNYPLPETENTSSSTPREPTVATNGKSKAHSKPPKKKPARRPKA